LIEPLSVIAVSVKPTSRAVYMNLHTNLGEGRTHEMTREALAFWWKGRFSDELWQRMRSPWCGLVLLSLAAVPTALAWERADVLSAIHQVENPFNTLRVGSRGELGPFQIRPIVWNTHTQKPFPLAADPVEAQIIAELHYEWIKRGLERNGMEVSPYHIGLVWNAGLNATVNGRATEFSRYYAQRVANLVEYATAPQPPPIGPATTTTGSVVADNSSTPPVANHP